MKRNCSFRILSHALLIIASPLERQPIWFLQLKGRSQPLMPALAPSFVLPALVTVTFFCVKSHLFSRHHWCLLSSHPSTGVPRSESHLTLIFSLPFLCGTYNDSSSGCFSCPFFHKTKLVASVWHSLHSCLASSYSHRNPWLICGPQEHSACQSHTYGTVCLWKSELFFFSFKFLLLNIPTFLDGSFYPLD